MHLRRPNRGSSDGVSFALDSMYRRPAPPGLMDSVGSVNAREYSENGSLPCSYFVVWGAE